MSIVEAKSLSRVFGKTVALKSASLKLLPQEEYAIIGASGSGKSTLLHLLGGLDRPSSGSVLVEGKNLQNMSDDELAFYRNRFVGFVFQFHYLLPTMSLHDNILLPLRIGNASRDMLNTATKRLAELASRMGIADKLQRFPYELSGGEQQRAAIIRALMMSPKLLLCDEPTGNLDSTNSTSVINLLREEAKRNMSVLVVVTHDQRIAGTFKNRIEMIDGNIV